MIEKISRYVAIGDSFTEGLWDPYPAPGGKDLQRGWADRLAGTLSERRITRGLPPIEYANHAIRGKLLGSIVAEQLPRALEQEPDLLSIVGGGNDILRPGTDPDELAKTLEAAVIQARRAGARVLMATGMDPIALPIVRRTRGKAATFNSHIWSIARNQGAAVLDLWGLRALQHPSMWAGDKIHLSPLGHHRVAQAALSGLGLSPDDPDWREKLSLPTLSRVDVLRDHGNWIINDVAPWLTRRVTHRSSGDARTPKFPDLATFEGSSMGGYNRPA